MVLNPHEIKQYHETNLSIMISLRNSKLSQVMKFVTVLLLFIITLLPSQAQESNRNNNPSNLTRTGFGTSVNGFNAGLGFVNPKIMTDGSAYYFDTWDTEAKIYTKKNGMFTIKNVNINLYDGTLEALYDEHSVFTFDSNNLVRLLINDKVFRLFTIDEKVYIYQLIFRDSFSVYKYHDVLFAEASVNPMAGRRRNKYIVNEEYYLYRNGELTKIKLNKKPFAKLFESDQHSEKDIINYLQEAQLAIKKESHLIKALKFVAK